VCADAGWGQRDAGVPASTASLREIDRRGLALVSTSEYCLDMATRTATPEPRPKGP
jgi:hypothetical protein